MYFHGNFVFVRVCICVCVGSFCCCCCSHFVCTKQTFHWNCDVCCSLCFNFSYEKFYPHTAYKYTQIHEYTYINTPYVVSLLMCSTLLFLNCARCRFFSFHSVDYFFVCSFFLCIFSPHAQTHSRIWRE